jgi:hypothetical protein
MEQRTVTCKASAPHFHLFSLLCFTLDYFMYQNQLLMMSFARFAHIDLKLPLLRVRFNNILGIAI